MACKNGIRESLERSKEHYKKERELEETCPFRAYWRDLVSRVFDPQQGFESLTEQEKAYYSVTCLNGEVYNGGFVQYFDNSAGQHYHYAESGLIQMGATESLRLLRLAKAEVFGADPVPKDRMARLQATDNDGIPPALAKLDDEFYEDPDALGEKLEAFALINGLVELV